MHRTIWICPLALALAVSCDKDSDHPANSAPGSQSSTSTGGNVDRQGTYQRGDGPADAVGSSDSGATPDGGVTDGG